MKFYPLTTKPKHYSGSNAKKNNYNVVMEKVVNYINEDFKDRPIDTIWGYDNPELARKLGENIDIIAEVIYNLDCGSNGITICKGDFDRSINRDMD